MIEGTYTMDNDPFKPTPLKPISEWVYDLYKVEYSETAYGPAVMTRYMTGSETGPSDYDIWEGVHGQLWSTWKRVAENVGHPANIGHMYGIPLSEGPIAHGQRVAKKLGLLK